jgi:transposase-like protein
MNEALYTASIRAALVMRVATTATATMIPAQRAGTTMSTPKRYGRLMVFTDAEAARLYLERRLWPHGPTCPRCGGSERITTRKGGYYRCNACKYDFTIRSGTILKRSHIPINKWLYAMRLLSEEKDNISSMRLAKEIGITQKSAWLMLRRIRNSRGSNDPSLVARLRTASTSETTHPEKKRVGNSEPHIS